MKKSLVYVAGPMTYLPQFNIPAFDAAAATLRAEGYEVISPAELDDPETRAAALASPDGAPGTGTVNGETWGDFLARDVKLITDRGVTDIALLPGWEKSRGARLESFVGLLNGVHFYLYMRTSQERLSPLVPVSRGEVLNAISGSFVGQSGLYALPGE